MITEISSFIASIKAAYDIAKGIGSLKAEVERNESIAKILEMLVSAQFQASEVLAKAHETEIEKYNLTKKLIELEKWVETEKQYKLQEVYSGVFAYVYKKGEGLPEPLHWLCANRWNDKKKSILQCETKDEYVSSYICQRCGKAIKWSTNKPISYRNEGII